MPARVISLAHVLDPRSPHGPPSPAFHPTLQHPHAPFSAGDPIGPGTVTSGSDGFTMGAHTGTHVDSRSHGARGGRFFDGTLLNDPGVQGAGVRLAHEPELVPFVGRGVLLDFAAHRGLDVIEDGEFDVDEVRDCATRQGTELRPGDAVLFRTGWDTRYACRSGPTPMPPSPGPGVEATAFLIERKVAVVGSDTLPFEVAPSDRPLEVHAMLIADHGIQILELMDLRELAASGVHEFVFVLAPLPIVGATASPVNPLAVLGDLAS